MKDLFAKLREFIEDRFNLQEDKGDELIIVDRIKRDITFKGTNLWALIFAILIASIGLNVNSTAVIIGAMLISPLMGPIMGVGLGIGINDFDLIKKGIKNLLIASVISVATSYVYFAFTPLHAANSELLARTNPTVWDVFIAFFGGLAGIIAGTRREKSNVIPGVAIATTLLPPLCTAGFGLATGQWYYVFGAVYLFFINSVFICLATFLIVKHLKFQQKAFASREVEKRVSRSILWIVLLTTIPSIYLAYRIVQRSIFETNAKRFVQDNFRFQRAQVVTHTYTYDGNRSKIELLLVGVVIPNESLDSLKQKLPSYNLLNTDLIVHQGLDAKQKIDLSEIKASILEDVYAAERASDSMVRITNKMELPLPDIKKELMALYPTLKEYSLGQQAVEYPQLNKRDTLTLFTGRFTEELSVKEKRKLQVWLTERIRTDSVKVVVE